MLFARNGFFAFESALHVLPAVETVAAPVIGVQAWNAQDTWRDRYEDLLSAIFFFAEDAFGGLFGIRDKEIVSFEPETGDLDVMADSLDGWAAAILSDHAQWTGHPVAHAWQAAHGAIPAGKRLLPKRPFILGGAFDVANLFAVDAVKGMRYRGDLWRQLRDLPDGAQVRLMPLPLH
ncbi:SMI1/KNR4 family protein [Mitsuaria sp. GD03876]|uniref:SMI1/KNR4 family protein n=1 Tax=Mitsuaria sp. GD03876 TaxID=2975399 RepID=UPI00244996C7|nr:SMI1/KNR4 family protein [Mitsuaria sp. GD03876]MDH0865430.1 SMI1/KNR4 family protein [Mitsuaria sp. GD03876]